MIFTSNMEIKTSACAGKSRFGESSWVKKLDTLLLGVVRLSYKIIEKGIKVIEHVK